MNLTLTGPSFKDNELQIQSILMVWTGAKFGLGEPVNLETVREQALPLARPEVKPHDGNDAVRVILATAVRFVVDLQRREEVALPHSALGSTVDPSLCAFAPHGGMEPDRMLNADAGIYKILEVADEKGINNVREARNAVLGVKGAQRGPWSHRAELMPPHFDGVGR